MEVRPVTPDAGAQPGEQSPADGSGSRGLLRYRSAQGRWVVAAMIVGSSVAGIDSTVVAVALPAIGRNLHAGFGGLQWTVTGYTLTLASLILLAGSLSDRWGRRRVFLVGLGWFTLASVLCAAAPPRRTQAYRTARRSRPHPALTGGTFLASREMPSGASNHGCRSHGQGEREDTGQQLRCTGEMRRRNSRCGTT
jgi:hypothetical protein